MASFTDPLRIVSDSEAEMREWNIGIPGKTNEKKE